LEEGVHGHWLVEKSIGVGGPDATG
jgi:hypothetical protein